MKSINLALLFIILIFTGCGSNGSTSTTQPQTPSTLSVDGAPVLDTLQPTIFGVCGSGDKISLLVDKEPLELYATCENNTFSIKLDDNLTHKRYCFSAFATSNNGIDSVLSEETCAFVGRAFITTWKTDNKGWQPADTVQITIISSDAYNYDYNFSVDWGDGEYDIDVVESIKHTYEKAGIYTVKINGDFPIVSFFPINDFGKAEPADKLIALNQWGSMPFESMGFAFLDHNSTEFNATDIPNLSKVLNARAMFASVSMTPKNINDWNVSNIEDMSHMFSRVIPSLDFDISGWDVSSAKNLKGMFSHALSVLSYDKLLNAWSKLPLQQDVTFGAGSSQYSSASKEARDKLISDFNWTIIDGGCIGECG